MRSEWDFRSVNPQYKYTSPKFPNGSEFTPRTVHDLTFFRVFKGHFAAARLGSLAAPSSRYSWSPPQNVRVVVVLAGDFQHPVVGRGQLRAEACEKPTVHIAGAL